LRDSSSPSCWNIFLRYFTGKQDGTREGSHYVLWWYEKSPYKNSYLLAQVTIHRNQENRNYKNAPQQSWRGKLLILLSPIFS
jgi:hypothetical protein